VASPSNAVDIARILIDAGAEPDATCDSYGGNSTAMTLLVSSAHPAAAGVQSDLIETLCKAGAKPNGRGDDGMPLWSAIVAWYPPAAEALVRCGARVDNLLFAAAVGDLTLVKSYFDEAGRPLQDRAYRWGSARAMALPRPQEKTLHPERMLEYALHWAAAFRRRSVVEFLLTKHPDLQVREPLWNNTILQAAMYGGDPNIINIIKPLFGDSAGGTR
jgi:ankyrin repeat protein